jgi:hypothetical protein
MIRINLLPSEKRKAERTPLPHFFLILVNAAALLLFGAGIVYFTLIKIPAVERDIQTNLNLRRDLQPKVEEHDALQKELEALKQKVQQIDQLTNRSVEWWQAVNAVWDVIQENPKVWIDDIKMLDSRTAVTEVKKSDAASKDNPPFGLTMRCHVSGEEVLTLTKFRETLKNNPTLLRLMPDVNINVDWKKDDEKDFQEKFSLSFTVSIFGRIQAPAAPAPAKPPTPAPSATPVSAPPAPPAKTN